LDHGNTPLHFDAQNGHINLVQFLVEHNAIISLRNQYGKTPLRLAQIAKEVEIVEYLQKFESKCMCRVS